MKRNLFSLFSLLILVSLLVSPVAAQTGTPNRPFSFDPSTLTLDEPAFTYEVLSADSEILKDAIRTDDGRIRVIVELEDAPAGLYTGGVAGYAPTNPEVTGAERFDPASPAVQTYMAYLDRVQDRFVSDLSRAVPSASVDYRYTAAMNAMAMAIAPGDLAALNRMPGIKAVYPDQLSYATMDASLDLINASAAWTAAGGMSDAGAGVKVAVIDSGIYEENAMFDGTGYTYPTGYPLANDYCGATDPTFCNGKIIAARYYTPTFAVHAQEVFSPRDIDGHGSHTAGTSAGNPVTTSPALSGLPAADISGVAPAAYIMAYKGLFTVPDASTSSGSNSMLLGALNDVLLDGADVVNNSWGGGAGGDPQASVYRTAIQSLTAGGVVVVFSAGNDGPDSNTIGCPGCVEEALTVAAATTGREFNSSVDVTAPTPVPGDLVDLTAVEGSGGPFISTPLSGEIEYYTTNAIGCTATGGFPADYFDGKLALISRGSCTFVEKVTNAVAAGAIGVIVHNNNADAPFVMSVPGTTVPSYMISQADGLAVAAYIAANTDAEARINLPAYSFDADNADVLADFSSAGPNGDPEVLKPDITAPGVDILSAFSPVISYGREFSLLSGTSMSSPHVTGAAALMTQLYPSWTPQQIKTALTSTAVQTVYQFDGVTPATPFNMGAGRLDLARAIEAGATFAKPSFATAECVLGCSFTNRITNVQSTGAMWEASYEAPGGMGVTISPSTFSGTATDFTVDFDLSQLPGDQWYFGAIMWNDTEGDYPQAYLPFAIYNSTATAPGTFTKTASTNTAGDGQTVSFDLTVTNNEVVTTTYTVSDVLPLSLEYVSGSATGGMTYDSGTRTLSGTAVLGPASIGAELSPFISYDPLAGYGVTPLACSATCDETIINLTGLPPFEWNGQVYTSAAIVSNGYIIPGGGTVADVDYINQQMPDPTAPNNVLAPFWTDLDLAGGDGGGTMSVASFNGGQFLAFEWTDAELYADPSEVYNFQIWMYTPLGLIWYSYGDMTGSFDFASIGAEDANGLAGVSYYYDGAGGPVPDEPDNYDIDVFAVPGGSQTFSFDAVASGSVDDVIVNQAMAESMALSMPAMSWDRVVIVDNPSLRVVHLAPFASTDASVSVTVDGAPALTDFTYGDSIPYLPFAPVVQEFGLVPTGSMTPAYTEMIDLPGGFVGTAVAIGNNFDHDLDILALADNNTAPSAGTFHLRVVHAAPFVVGAATADLRLDDDTVVVNDLDFGEFTGYIPLAAGTYDLKITTADGSVEVIDLEPVTFQAGDIVTVFAVGDGYYQPLGGYALPHNAPGFFLPVTSSTTVRILNFFPTIFQGSVVP